LELNSSRHDFLWNCAKSRTKLGEVLQDLTIVIYNVRQVVENFVVIILYGV